MVLLLLSYGIHIPLPHPLPSHSPVMERAHAKRKTNLTRVSRPVPLLLKFFTLHVHFGPRLELNIDRKALALPLEEERFTRPDLLSRTRSPGLSRFSSSSMEEQKWLLEDGSLCS